MGEINRDSNMYAINNELKEVLKNEQIKLTPARAMLLGVLYDLVKNGEFASEFASEKVVYFLQRFGAKEAFQLEYQPNFYGPYSGKVKHVLYYLNGSYIMGYSSKDKKPFEELNLVLDAEKDVEAFLDLPENFRYKKIVEKTRNFLDGFYSPFALELLSTIDFIIIDNKVNSIEEITCHLNNRSDRKKTLFSTPRFIQIGVNNIVKHLPFIR